MRALGTWGEQEKILDKTTNSPDKLTFGYRQRESQSQGATIALRLLGDDRMLLAV